MLMSPAKAISSQKRRNSAPQQRADKFEQVLLYILFQIGGKPNIGQTVLYKILYFIDFDYYEKFQEQLIGAKYIKNLYGPTPIMFAEVVKKLEKENKIETVKSKFYQRQQKKYLVNPDIKLDLSTLTGREIDHINQEIKRFGDWTAKQISDFSHLDTPWLVAENKEVLEYEHVFYRPAETSVGDYDEL